MNIRTIVILLALQVFETYGDKCSGDLERFEPCSCTMHETLGLTISCENKTMSEVYDVFDRISPENLEIQSVNIRDEKATNLRANLFNGSTVAKVKLQLPSLRNVHENVFEGQDNTLLIVNFLSSDLSDIPTVVLKKLKNLKAFGFTDSKRIRFVNYDSFKGFTGVFSLKVIIYKKNSISFLDDNAFAHLKRIELIDLTHNNLKCIDQSSFPTRMPRTLMLAYNNLRDLHLDFLRELHQGSAIYLGANKVEHLSREFFRTLIRKGIFISLDKNELVCGCSMMPVATANRNNLGNQFKGTCKKPAHLDGLQLSNLTYEDFPTCKEENEDLISVVEATFNTNLKTIVHVDEEAIDNLELTGYKIRNNLNL